MTTPEEFQKIQEEFRNEQLNNKVDPIEITKEIEDRFIKSLESGSPFRMSFNISSSHSIVIRDKTVREDEIVKRSVNKLIIKSGSINWAEYSRVVNECFLYYQLDSINDIDIIRQYPNSIYDDFNLYSHVENDSIILSMPLSRLYVYMATMFQFNGICQELSKRVVDNKNFFFKS